MPWTINNPPNPIKNKSKEAIKVGVEAANRVLAKGGSEQDAIFAAIAAAKNAEGPKKIEKSQSVLEKFRLQEQIKKEAQEKEVVKAALPAGSIAPDPKRSLVHADFNREDRLVLTFDDGKQLKTKPINQVLNVDQYVSANVSSVNSSGSATSASYVRNLSGFTVSILPNEHLLTTVTSVLVKDTVSSKIKEVEVKIQSDQTVIINSNVNLDNHILVLG